MWPHLYREKKKKAGASLIFFSYVFCLRVRENDVYGEDDDKHLGKNKAEECFIQFLWLLGFVYWFLRNSQICRVWNWSFKIWCVTIKLLYSWFRKLSFFEKKNSFFFFLVRKKNSSFTVRRMHPVPCKFIIFRLTL